MEATSISKKCWMLEFNAFSNLSVSIPPIPILYVGSVIDTEGTDDGESGGNVVVLSKPQIRVQYSC